MPDQDQVVRTPSTRRSVAQAFGRRHFLTILVGLLAIAYSYLPFISAAEMADPLSTHNVMRLLLLTVFFVLLLFGGFPKYQLFQAATSVLVPLSVILVLVYVWIDAQGADDLSKEDFLIEDLSFLLLMVGAFCMGLVALAFARRRQWLSMVVAGLLALVFFVIGMEEVSWFMRALKTEPGDFFLEHNDQQETNFHNIFTSESEDLFYLGGFLLLVLFPFFRGSLADLVHRSRLSSAHVLLPSPWLIAPFVLAGAFALPRYLSRPVTSTILVGSLVVMIAMIACHIRRREWWGVGQFVFTLVLFLVTVVIFLGFDLEGRGVRPWLGKEYHEFYISWGIAAYAAGVLYETLRGRDRVPVTPQHGSR